MKTILFISLLVLGGASAQVTAQEWVSEINLQVQPRFSTVLLNTMYRRYLTDPQKEVLEFEEASLHYEQNETEDEAEILIRVDADRDIRMFAVFDALGGEVLRLRSSPDRELGFAESLLESSEPSISEVQAMFPEGLYTFVAFTYDDALLISDVTLRYDVLPAPRFAPKGAILDRFAARVDFAPEAGAMGYVVELENEELGFSQITVLGPDASGFGIAPELLEPGFEYEIVVGTLNEFGNLSSAQSVFEVR